MGCEANTKAKASTTSSEATDTGGITLLVPAYFVPGPEWDALIAAIPAVGIVVLNPASGPGDEPYARYGDHVAALRGAGVRVVGYVDTSFGQRASAAVLDEVERHGNWYGVEGVFFDQVSVECSRLSYYLELAAGARGHGCQLVILNPGTLPCECLLGAGDIIVTIENNADTYLRHATMPEWARRYEPRHFCHLVYGVTGTRRVASVVAAARRRRAGWVYVTHLPAGRLRDGGVAAHPWAGLPEQRHWGALVEALSADDGTPTR